MDFKTVLKKILSEFEREGIRYALMGGFALGVWGLPRGTVDIDFLVEHNHLNQIKKIMANLGYKCIYETENVSQYISPEKTFGEIDFLHAFREPSREMLKRSVVKEIFQGEIRIKVLKPEDLIGLKVQAIANDESRKAFDLADIESLLSRFRQELDWNLINKYFEIFNFREIFLELKKKHGHSQ